MVQIDLRQTFSIDIYVNEGKRRAEKGCALHICICINCMLNEAQMLICHFNTKKTGLLRSLFDFSMIDVLGF